PTDAERRPTPIGGLRAASPIGSRVKRLAQGELMLCVNSYWVLPDAEIRRFDGFAAAPLRENQQRLEGWKLKLTRHNGRSGKHGTYNPRHNDRRFDVENSEHIDAQRAKKNVYWDCYRGFTTPELREKPEQRSEEHTTELQSRFDLVCRRLLQKTT